MNSQYIIDETKLWRHLWNGVAYYNYGVYHQIENINLIIATLDESSDNNHLRLNMLLELKSYLEAIARAGDIPSYK